MKKLLFIGLVVAGFAFASTSGSDAGVSVGIGIGIPGVTCIPYYAIVRMVLSSAAYYPRPYYYRTAFYSGPRWYWHRGHRVYYSRPYHYRRH